MLYLIPTPLSNGPAEPVLPVQTLEVIHSLDLFVVEELRTARRFLKSIGYKKSFEEVVFIELNEHTGPAELPSLIKPLLAGKNAGLLSEAGCPAIADPGAALVLLAHKHHIKVIPLTGPSSILLALMSSGLNGQNFAFNGYLPKQRDERVRKIRERETVSRKENQTQIFIETPYRNNHLLEDLLAHCHPGTRLCIAADLTSADEFIHTRKIADWRKQPPDLDKKQVVFLFLS